METSQRTSQIQLDPRLRDRIEAIVRTYWWSTPGVADPTQPVPVDGLAWAVAANADVQNAVIAQQSEDNGNNAVPRGLEKVSDETLSAILLDPDTGALARLTP